MSRAAAIAKLAEAAQLSARAKRLVEEATAEIQSSDSEPPPALHAEPTEAELAATRRSMRRFGRGI